MTENCGGSIDGDVYNNNNDNNGITFNSDGTTMLTVDGDDNKFYRWTLSTPWDITTATFTGDEISAVIDGEVFFLYSI